MSRLLFVCRRLDERGATAIEYAIVAAVISVAVIVSLEALSISVTGQWDSVASAFD